MREYKNLGELLRKARLEKNMTQTYVGNKLKLTPQFASNWERGYCAPPTQQLQKVLSLLDIEPDVAAAAMMLDAEIVIRHKVFGPKAKRIRR